MLVQHDTDLWSAEHEFGWQAGLVPIPVRMTVIRLGDGPLILHSPIPISRELRGELDALGPVGFIVVPRAHGRFAEQASQSFPAARLVAAPSAPSRRKSLPFHASLADQPPDAWTGQVESHLVRGFPLQEVVLFHRPTRTLVLTDLCFNIQRSSSRTARLFFRANGMWQRFGPSRIIRRVVTDRSAFQRSLERLLLWDFERIVPGHGDVVEQGGRAALRAAWLTRLLSLVSALAAFSGACATGSSPVSISDPETFCSEPSASDLKILHMTESDRTEICSLLAHKHEYGIVLVARSHEDIYDFPMIEVHMAEVSDRDPTRGPVFFYWKRTTTWSELQEVSNWYRPSRSIARRQRSRFNCA